jgi:hypothetical protein
MRRARPARSIAAMRPANWAISPYSPGWRFRTFQAPASTTETTMPRYLIERTFPDGLTLPTNAEGARAAADVIANNARDGVTWIHSYVTPDRRKTFCIYDGPSPEAIRSVANNSGLPVDRISEVKVLDPYFLH